MVSVVHRINAAFGVSNKFVPYRPNYDLVAENMSNILWDSSTTIGTDWTLTKIVLNAPLEAVVKLEAVLFWQNSSVRGIRITRSNNSADSDIVTSNETETDLAQIRTEGFGIKNYGVNTYYVWAKSKVSGKNYVGLMYTLMNKTIVS